MTVDETLNELLVRIFKNILEIEEKYLITEEFKDISANDMHILEAVGVEEPKRMSELARSLDITMGTLTKAMDALEKKGYVDRNRSEDDKRVVKASLRERGKIAYYHHEQFHRQMIEHVKDGLSDQEMTVLIYSLAKLLDYFQGVYNISDEENQYQSWAAIKEDDR